MNFLASKAQLRASFARWSLFLVPLIVLLGFLGGQMGSPSTVWFQSLSKPSIYPPPAAFGIVWTILYVMIGFSVALVASAWGAFGRGIAIIAFALHFIGNLAWTYAFFGLQNMQLGLGVLVYTALSLVVVIWLFWRVRRIAGLLLLPYLAWVLFASVLNWQFIVENPDGGAGAKEAGAVERIEL
ncbi:tryptophan-rich sensory protein [Erythrobacter sp. SCSIO 43205]|uniref:TspO/MBR family protein n=1 Tax=Erythrobacter sp. SCSIO 43205 TaxID=2779361 RepID=UPI001CA7E470|nr:TspO/MBR family protein [Erythrobacter sp. SCSIO 43205]UAB77512.1 tryptophan-rich sensory protein [Erythrobacter sp. SCSIO 43205]